MCADMLLPGVPLAGVAAFSSMPGKLSWSGLDRMQTSQDCRASVCRYHNWIKDYQARKLSSRPIP